ncbi:MAG: hypothetical protein HY906_11885 [Deltaproteobacteria bacterium]|nr:hypothetical protein [Deltaproteobacteria bacterium]
MTMASQGGPQPDPIVVLEPVTSPKAWGEELWLDSARPEGMARIAGQSPAVGLATWLERDPRPLGRHARALFGDTAPVFTKVIRTGFPPLVHVGFRRRVERDTLLGVLAAEQGGLRELRRTLGPGRAAFDGFQRRYAAWATAQALARWQLDDAVTLAGELGPYVSADAARSLPATLTALRRNRAEFVDLLNEIDFEAEAGSLFLTPAGTMHAIFGLSHQTHPLDPSRRALADLFQELAAARARNAPRDEIDADLDALIAAAPLTALRRGGAAPPKNEAWLPLRLDGKPVIVEPQQSSDTTYSLADFYTPFVWGDGEARFRKGDAAAGLSVAQLEAYLQSLDLEATPIEQIRRRPEPVALAGTGPVRLFRVVDEPEAWPFFTVYTLELDGSPGRPAQLRGAPPAGVFQSVVVLEGAVSLRAENGPAPHRLAARTAAWVGADSGHYRLSSSEAARVLLVSVPGPRGGAPQVDT